MLGFEFGGYELWPSSLSFETLPIPQPVRPRAAGEFTIGSLNLFRLFDDVNDAAARWTGRFTGSNTGAATPMQRRS